MRGELTTAEGLLELHAAHVQKRPEGMETVWDDEIRRLLSAWKAETGNAELPVRSAVDFIYESLAEQKRVQRLGRGVFLGTAHGVKGLEFPHGFILDGGWPAPSNAAAMEEERRLYYVAMTRAMETLTVFRRTDCRNWHVEALNGPHLLDRRGNGVAEVETGRLRRYEILGMGQVYLDFAGGRPEDAPVHRTLSKVNTGDLLYMGEKGGKIVLIAESGMPVARLPRSAATVWRDRLDDIEKITVIAMIRRRAEDAALEYRGRLRCEWWEVPVVEITTLK